MTKREEELKKETTDKKRLKKKAIKEEDIEEDGDVIDTADLRQKKEDLLNKGNTFVDLDNIDNKTS